MKGEGEVGRVEGDSSLHYSYYYCTTPLYVRAQHRREGTVGPFKPLLGSKGAETWDWELPTVSASPLPITFGAPSLSLSVTSVAAQPTGHSTTVTTPLRSATSAPGPLPWAVGLTSHIRPAQLSRTIYSHFHSSRPSRIRHQEQCISRQVSLPLPPPMSMWGSRQSSVGTSTLVRPTMCWNGPLCQFIHASLFFLALLLLGVFCNATSAPPTDVEDSACTALSPWSLSGSFLVHSAQHLILPRSCLLITARASNDSSCTSWSSPCWHTLMGVDLRTGQPTFTTPLDVPEQPSYGLTEPFQLSSSGQLVYWLRGTAAVNHGGAGSCSEALAFTLEGRIVWRFEQCSNSWASLLVFHRLLSGDDVLLLCGQTQWAALLGSTGAVLHQGPAEVSGDILLDDEATGLFTVEDSTFTLSPNGSWALRRVDSPDGSDDRWATVSGATLLQKASPFRPALQEHGQWRGVDRVTGDVLWENDTDSSITSYTWEGVQSGASDNLNMNPYPYLYVQSCVSPSGPSDLLGGLGFIDPNTGWSYASPVLGPIARDDDVMASPSTSQDWFDERTLAFWFQNRWVVCDWPSMAVLAYGDVSLTAVYGGGGARQGAMGRPTKVCGVRSLDTSGPHGVRTHHTHGGSDATTWAGDGAPILLFLLVSISAAVDHRDTLFVLLRLDGVVDGGHSGKGKVELGLVGGQSVGRVGPQCAGGLLSGAALLEEKTSGSCAHRVTAHHSPAAAAPAIPTTSSVARGCAVTVSDSSTSAVTRCDW